jgi:hypothetical protein
MLITEVHVHVVLWGGRRRCKSLPDWSAALEIDAIDGQLFPKAPEWRLSSGQIPRHHKRLRACHHDRK